MPMIDMKGVKYICSCYYRKNVFLHSFKLHVTFLDEEQFKCDYAQVLSEKGFTGDWSVLIQEVENEILRRKEDRKKSLIRKQHVKENYIPLHKHLYDLKESYLAPIFLELVEYCKIKGATRDELIKKIAVCKADRVYSLPVFTKKFCEEFIEELKRFEESDVPKGRPNTMNTTGLLLEEMGFYANFVDPLRTNYLSPIASLLYPEWVGNASGLDSQRAFIVTYKTSGDGIGARDDEEMTDLALHFDNAEVTINVSLSDGFEGGELFFSGLWKEPAKQFRPVVHQHSYGVIHRGRHLHGAMPLDSGERYNLIIWMRSSSVRNEQCPMCDQRPVLVATEGEGSGFTDGSPSVVQVCNVI